MSRAIRMWTLILAAALFLPAAGRCQPVHRAPAISPFRVVAAGGTAEIPFLLLNNHILVRGTVGDSDSLWFIVDTGAQSHALNESTAKRLGLSGVGDVRAQGAAGAARGTLLTGVDLALPGLRSDDIPVAAIPLDPIGIQNGLGCDGVIGYPLFERNVVEIDYARGLLRIRDSESFEYPGTGAVLPLTFEQNHPYVMASITLPGRAPIEGRFVLDTGSALALVLSAPFVEREQALRGMKHLLQARLGGVGGWSMNSMGRVESLRLGPYELPGPVTVFSQSARGRFAAEGALGNIGGDVLRRFHVTLDYPRKRMILEPGPGSSEPFEADMSGLWLRVREDSTRAVEVVIVQEGSPAQELRIETGDVLESVDGAPVSARTLADVRRALRQPGRTVRLALRRGEDRREVTLTTRRLI